MTNVYMSDGHYSGEMTTQKTCRGRGLLGLCHVWLEKATKISLTAWRPGGLSQEAETASAKALRQHLLEKRQGSQCSGSRVNRGRAPEVRSWGKEDSQRRTLAVDLEWSGSHARLL